MLEKSQRLRAVAEPKQHGAAARHASNGSNVDRVLFKNLVEMVPLVESLMDRRASSTFRRRASVVYTPAPAHPSKVDWKGSRTTQTVSVKKKRDIGDSSLPKHVDNGDDTLDDFSIFSSSQLTAEDPKKDEEIALLREQFDDLQRKILEKDEALEFAEKSINQMKTVYKELDELRHLVAEKDSLIKSSTSQLSNAKIKLADKQAALEKLDWEARASKTKVEELQADLDSVDLEITALMQLFGELSKNDSAAYPDSKTTFHQLEHLPHIDMLDDVEMEKMEKARMIYAAAVAAAREDPSDESLAAVVEARLKLQSFVF